MNCSHHEIMSHQEGNLIGTCKKCGQVKQYDPKGHEKPIILKEGNMGDTKPTQLDNMAIECVPKSPLMNKGEKHRYYERNREKILEDVRLLGRSAARKRWGIEQSSWAYLMKRWLPATNVPQTDDGDSAVRSQGNVGNNDLKALTAPLKKKAAEAIFYRENREKILEDAKFLGETEARKRWGIPSSSWHYLMKRWKGIPQTQPRIKKPVGLSSMPKLPEWNEAWGDVVKVAWLGCLQALINRGC